MLDYGPLPSLRVGDVTRSESQGTMTFNVTLDVPDPDYRTPVTVNYATANSSATAGSDYVATNGSLSFGRGQRSQPVSVTLQRFDCGKRGAITLNLTGSIRALIADGQAIGTITDDDLPQISISDVARVEGDTGATDFVFDISLNQPSTLAVTLTASTVNNTAVAQGDYAAKSQTITIPAGRRVRRLPYRSKATRCSRATKHFMFSCQV